jgi:glutamyl-tRNA reductase
VPTIRALRSHAEQARDDEVQRALKLLARGDDPKQVLEALSHGLTNKLMHAPTQALNEASAEERNQLAELVSRLYRIRGQH